MTSDLKSENMLNVCMSKSYFANDSHCLKYLSSELSIKIIMPPSHNSYFIKSLKSDWLSTVLISALIGQCVMTVHVMPNKLGSTRHHTRALKWLFSLLTKNSRNFRILVF